MPSFFQSDTVKKVLAALAVVNGALLTSGVLPAVGITICSILASVFAGLGIVSGGTVGAQPKPALPALVK